MKKEGKMRLNKYLIAVALVVMFMAFWVGKVTAYDMTQYVCSLNDGDWWEGLYTYSVVGGPNDGASGSHQEKILLNGTELVNGVERIKREILVNGSVDRYYCVDLDTDGFKMYKEYVPVTGNYFIFEPPFLTVPAEFDIGDDDQSSYSVLVHSINTDSHIDTSAASQTVSFESVEPVTVPYGTFEDCLRIFYVSSSESPTSGIGTAIEETSWFAHKVGRIKQETTLSWYNLPGVGDMELTFTWELTDYDANFPCPMKVALGKDSNDLKTLRKFRDEVLSKNPAGQEIIRLYYQLSPAIVTAMKQDEGFKEDVKEMIKGILPLVRLYVVKWL
jgi:hypothetical protein